MSNSESNIQARIRLQAAHDSVLLMTNKSGALTAENGRLIRFGLGHDSAAVNEKQKSADLVGIKPLLITQAMVGQIVGQFIAIECKTASFRGSSDTARSLAQERWLQTIIRYGGVGGFASSVEMAQCVWGSRHE